MKWTTNLSQPTDKPGHIRQPRETLAKNLPEKNPNSALPRDCQHVDWIEGLHQLSRSIVSARDRNSVVKRLLEIAAHVRNVQAITVRLCNPVTGHLDATACGKLDATDWRATIPSGGVGLSRPVIESQAPVMVLDIQHSPSARHSAFLNRHGLVSYLGVPLFVGGRVTGVIGYYSKNAQGFHSDEIQYLTTLADVSAISIDATRLREQNTEQAVHIGKAGVSVDKSEKAKSEFLGVMSHEFRTPLNLIMGYAGMMQDGMLGELNDEQRNSLERIMQCSDNLLAMVMSILEASTIETGAVRLYNEYFDPKDLLEELKAACYVPPEKDLELTWNWPADLPALKTDREKLKQVLEHLIDNALKFSERGRVIISAELGSSPATVRFTIADTGLGIPPEVLPFVFEKFRQSDSSMTRSHGGVGLGLYIAKKFTDLIGGELSVKSELGRGSVFTVSLPTGW
jgi:signal transduction histidine kinase